MITALKLIPFAAVLWTAGTSPRPAEPRRVVLLFDERRDLPGMSILNADFLQSLRSGSPGPVEIYSEEMDLSRHHSENYLALLRNHLRAKYADKKIDVAVAVMGPSLDFLAGDGKDVFPGTPIVFCGIDRREFDSRVLPSYATGVLVKREFSPTLNLALKLHPGTRRIVVVGGTSEFDSRIIGQAREEFRAFEDRLKFTYLTARPMPELLKELSKLPPQTIVLYTTLFQDGAGSPFVPHEAAEQIAAASSAPVYGFVDQYLGRGIVGGHLYNLGTQGEEAAKLTLRILSGTRPRELQLVEPGANTAMFDWRQLRRWGIREDQLPPNSIVQFKELSFWELYRGRAAGVVVFVAAQSLLIAGLLVQRSRRTRAEASRQRSEGSLQKLTSQLMHVQEQERRRIAAELHDGLGQDLAVIRNRATIGLRQTANTEIVSEQLKEISSMAASAIDELREIAHDLRPYELDRLGLTHAIESMIAKVPDHSSPRFSSDLDNIDGLLSTDAETGIYRIVQEGIDNVIKHAGATEARVTVKQHGHELAVTIADNGIGIERGVKQKLGFGLVGVRERARTLGGSCAVHSRPGKGTILTVWLAIPSEVQVRQTG